MNDVAARQTTDWASLLDRLWRLLASPRLTVILLVWATVVLTLSAIIPQAPPHLEDPIVRSQWLASVPISVRPVVEQLQSFGVFDLLDSVWLYLPLALMLAHALVMLADLGPPIWYRARSSSNGKARSLGKSFPLDRDRPESVERVAEQLITRLKKAGYRVLTPQERNTTSGRGQEDFIAWRWRWNWLGLAGIYLGLGLACIGLILDGWLGQVQEVILRPNSPVPLLAAGAPNLDLGEVTVAGNDPLRPATGVASIRILTGVGEQKQLTLKLHSSHLFRGTWLTLVDLRPVAKVAAVDVETGENVLIQPFSPRASARQEVRLALTGDPEMRFAGLPSQNVTLRADYQTDAAYPSSSSGGQNENQHPNPAFSLSFFRGAEARPSKSVSLGSGDEVTFDGVRYLIAFDYDAALRANSALWWIVVAVGWGVVALSFIALTIAPPVYVQASVERAGKGSHFRLTVDVLGDKRRPRRELRGLITPDD